MQKAIFLDIDGTLLEGFITIDFVKYLASIHQISESSFSNLSKLSLEYKLGNLSFEEWVSRWTAIWLEEIKGKDILPFESAAKTFFNNYSRIYPFSKKLIDLFKAKGYVVVGVSVGLMETAKLVKEFLGMDFVFASTLETNKGKYTGRLLTNLQNPDGKKEIVVSFCKKENISLSNSFSCGDSTFDLPMLSLTGHKIVINADDNLLSFAKSNNYLIASKDSIIGLTESYLKTLD